MANQLLIEHTYLSLPPWFRNQDMTSHVVKAVLLQGIKCEDAEQRQISILLFAQLLSEERSKRGAETEEDASISDIVRLKTITADQMAGLMGEQRLTHPLIAPIHVLILGAAHWFQSDTMKPVECVNEILRRPYTWDVLWKSVCTVLLHPMLQLDVLRQLATSIRTLKDSCSGSGSNSYQPWLQCCLANYACALNSTLYKEEPSTIILPSRSSSIELQMNPSPHPGLQCSVCCSPIRMLADCPAVIELSFVPTAPFKLVKLSDGEQKPLFVCSLDCAFWVVNEDDLLPYRKIPEDDSTIDVVQLEVKEVVPLIAAHSEPSLTERFLLPVVRSLTSKCHETCRHDFVCRTSFFFDSEWIKMMPLASSLATHSFRIDVSLEWCSNLAHESLSAAECKDKIRHSFSSHWPCLFPFHLDLMNRTSLVSGVKFVLSANDQATHLLRVHFLRRVEYLLVVIHLDVLKRSCEACLLMPSKHDPGLVVGVLLHQAYDLLMTGCHLSTFLPTYLRLLQRQFSCPATPGALNSETSHDAVSAAHQLREPFLMSVWVMAFRQTRTYQHHTISQICSSPSPLYPLPLKTTHVFTVNFCLVLGHQTLVWQTESHRSTAIGQVTTLYRQHFRSRMGYPERELSFVFDNQQPLTNDASAPVCQCPRPKSASRDITMMVRCQPPLTMTLVGPNSSEPKLIFRNSFGLVVVHVDLTNCMVSSLGQSVIMEMLMCDSDTVHSVRHQICILSEMSLQNVDLGYWVSCSQYQTSCVTMDDGMEEHSLRDLLTAFGHHPSNMMLFIASCRRSVVDGLPEPLVT